MAVTRCRVCDLSPGRSVSGPFLAKDKQLRSFSNRQGNFLLLTLQDNTGEVGAVLWEVGADLFDSFEDGDILWVEGEVRLHNKALQVAIESLFPCPKDQYDIRDFLPHTRKDVNLLLRGLLTVIDGIKDPFLHRLLDSFFSDLAWVSAFKEAPAAKSVHHAYIGGLIEHTASVVSLLERIAEVYPLNRELLFTGGILHDIGKIAEYRYDRLIDMSDEGRLLGHIVIGAQMVRDRIGRIQDFPQEPADLICHMILSHHGSYEFGSPKRPKTPEASALHYADALDAEVTRFLYIMETQRKVGRRWSAYDPILERYIYLGQVGDRSGQAGEGGLPAPNFRGFK